MCGGKAAEKIDFDLVKSIFIVAINNDEDIQGVISIQQRTFLAIKSCLISACGGADIFHAFVS